MRISKQTLAAYARIASERYRLDAEACVGNERVVARFLAQQAEADALERAIERDDGPDSIEIGAPDDTHAENGASA